MIYSPTKPYQVALWTGSSRQGEALRLEFDSREEAEQALRQKAAEGRYHTGILFEWNKHLNDWTLLSQYPD